MPRATAAALVAAAALFAAGGSSAEAAGLPADTTVVISGQPDLLSLLAAPAGAATVDTGQALDGAGTHVVFSATSDGLVADDDDDVQNVYVKDLASGAVQLVSRRSGAAGEPSHADCFSGAISDDGTHVAFVCSGPLDPADTNGRSDVYVRDLVQQTTTLVSRADGNGAGDPGALGVGGDSSEPAIDAHGAFVAFGSTATNFVAGGGTALRIYRRDVANGRTELISQPSGSGAPPTGQSSFSPSISHAGRLVAFSTDAPLDATADTNITSDIYVRDATSDTTTLVSRRSTVAGGAVGNGPSIFGLISGDGTRVAFESFASNLDATNADTDSAGNLYERSLATGVTQLFGRRQGGAKIDDAAPQGISADGARVAFVTVSTRDAYVDDAGVARLVSVDGAQPNPPSFGDVTVAAISGNGQRVAMSVGHGIAGDVMPHLASVVVRDLAASATRTVSRPDEGASFLNDGGDALDGSVSADGRSVAFVSAAAGLGVPDRQARLFVRDTETGAVTLAGRQDGHDGAPIAVDPSGFSQPRISGDGRRVAFLALDPIAGRTHLYVRDLASERTFVADRADGTDALDLSGPTRASIGDDGARVAFVTKGKLTPDDTDDNPDVYVRDLAANRTLLVDRATGEQGAKADAGVAAGAVISGDGHRVAFDTVARLDPLDGDDFEDVYVRDLDAHTTTLASVAGEAVKGDGRSLAKGIGRDGNRVLLLSAATNFGQPPGVPDKLWVRDLTAHTTTLAARADGPGGTPVAALDGSAAVALSADGAHVAFAAAPPVSIAPGAPGDGVARFYERDLASGSTRLLSRRAGAEGVPVDAFVAGVSPAVSLTADGGCAVFTGNGHLLTPPASSDRLEVFMRVLKPDCGRVAAPGPGPGPGPTPAPAKPAVLSRLSLRPARFFVAARKGGTKVLFRLDKSSSVTLTFDRLLAGHRKGKRCLTTVRKGRKCTVVRRVAGHLTIARARAGANTIAFSGKLGRRALAPGSYRLTATPLHGTARTVRFVVVKAPKPKPIKRKVHR